MQKRLHELDSLRGIAAVTVMLSHVFLVIPLVWNTSQPNGASWWLQILMFSPFRVIWAGHQAVIFFFCLSGFVLALPFFENRKQQPYGLYLIKRVLRIYPPYLAAAILAIVSRELIFNGSVATASGWFNQSWQSPISFRSLLDHIMMIGPFKNCDFNPVLWSLVHEMRISIFFPIIVWLTKKFNKLFLILPIAFTLLYQISISLKYRGIISYDHDYFDTIYYTSYFILGAYLAKNRKWLLEQAGQTNRIFKCLILAASLLAYTNAFWSPYFDFLQAGHLSLLITKVWVKDWISASAVVVFIILSMSSNLLSGILATKPLIFLGSISYSLYLFHALALKVIVTILSQSLPLVSALGIAVAIALAVSIASWRYIEIPSIELAKIIANRWPDKKPEIVGITDSRD
jgi:peptidoglycan/LPS O-acetylase OafA/YrhL